MDEQFKLGSSQPTEWSMWYNDQEKDLGIASDANELKEQLATISGYTDRSRVQKDFLSQKAMVRYWMDQVSRFGGAQDLAENLFNNRDNQLRWASPRLATDDTIDSSFNRPVPWANAGEGVLPELTNLDMQLDDWWVNRLNELNSENVDLINEFDPDGAFDLLIPPSDATTAYGSGTGGWVIDEDDAMWGDTGGQTDAATAGDLPELPSDDTNTRPDNDLNFFGSHWDDGGSGTVWGDNFWDDGGDDDPVVPVVRPDQPVTRPDVPVTRPDVPVTRPDVPVTRPDVQPVVPPDASTQQWSVPFMSSTTIESSSDYVEVTPEMHHAITMYENPTSAIKVV